MMLGRSYLEVPLPGGSYQLVLAHSGGLRSPSRRPAPQEQSEQAWFVLDWQLEQPIWSEVGPILDLYAKLTRERIVLTGQPGDSATMRRVREALKWGLDSGRLRFEVVLDPPSPRLRREPEPLPPRAPPREDELLFDFRVQFVDEVGEPLGGLDLYFAGPNAVETATTDASGTAEVTGKTWSSAFVEVASVEQLCAVLRPRWSQPRDPSPPVGPRVQMRRLENELGAVILEPTELHIVVVSPFSSCAQIPGSEFAFGSSFVLPSAIPQLGRIARNLQGTDLRSALIYGHTDRSGSDQLNKQLSERRAKAVHALLRHDAEAWEELWSGTQDTSPWLEYWGTEEGQIMLNALDVRDAEGNLLDEDGKLGPCTRAAIQRFQRGSYPKRPAEQPLLPETGWLDAPTRRELFLAYAKLISRHPVAEHRFANVNGSGFMGCGEFNPLSLSVRDAESRRVTILVFGPAAEPQGLPCLLGDLSPCQSLCGPSPDENAEELGEAADLGGGPLPYRCPTYQRLARECPYGGGTALTHDLVIRVPYELSEASHRAEVLILDSRDGTIRQEQSLAFDARASEQTGWSEVWFTDLPEARAYRLQCSGPEGLYTVFDYTPYNRLPGVPDPGPELGMPAPPEQLPTTVSAPAGEATGGSDEEATA